MFARALGYSIAAGLCTLIGAMMVLIRPRISRNELGFFLGLASGVMVAVVILDLIPPILANNDFGGFILGALGGCLIVALFNWILDDNSLGNSMYRLGYLIMLGIALHDLPEGMAIALGNEFGTRAASVIALAIGIHNMPEGMAIAAPMVMAGVSRGKIALNILLVGAVTPLGTLLGKGVMTLVPQYFEVFLGLAGGVMLYLVWFQLWPEAKNTRSSWRFVGLAIGFLLIFMATYI